MPRIHLRTVLVAIAFLAMGLALMMQHYRARRELARLEEELAVAQAVDARARVMLDATRLRTLSLQAQTREPGQGGGEKEAKAPAAQP